MSNKVYCMYCGTSNSNIKSLTTNKCNKNPNTSYHIPYEGSEKTKYTCRYCGNTNNSISSLTSNSCSKNPNSKYHVPMN